MRRNIERFWFESKDILETTSPINKIPAGKLNNKYNSITSA